MSFSHWHRRDLADTHVDVLIVGAGISGLSAAFWLRRRHPDLRVTIVDRGRVGSGLEPQHEARATDTVAVRLCQGGRGRQVIRCTTRRCEPVRSGQAPTVRTVQAGRGRRLKTSRAT